MLRGSSVVRRSAHVCATCGTGFIGGVHGKFCSPKCDDEYTQQRLRRLRCFRCNQPPRLMRWMRVSPTHEAPLCGTDECVIAWHPPDGWPDPTVRKLRKERQHDPIFVLSPAPRGDALLSEVDALTIYGRLRADPAMYEVMRAVINLLLETTTSGLPSNPYRDVPAFRILDLARALRQTLGDIRPGTLDHHLLECSSCMANARQHRMCAKGARMYAEECRLEFPMGLDNVQWSAPY